MAHRRKDRYANPGERIRFGSMRYIPPYGIAPNPLVFNPVTDGAQKDAPLPGIAPSYWRGQPIWATYFTAQGGDQPSWVLDDNSVVGWGAPNIGGTVFGDTGANLKGYALTVPATAKAVRIGINAPNQAALMMWMMGDLNAAGENNSAQVAPDHWVPSFARTQTYVIAACVSAAPSMSSIPGSDMGLVIGGQAALFGATNNTPGVVFPCTYDGTSKVGFYQWYTDSKPPIL